MWINHGVVARAEVAGVLPTSRGNAVASVAADVAHLVAHLLLPVVGASPRARPLAVYTFSGGISPSSPASAAPATSSYHIIYVVQIKARTIYR